jgi:hypothetical protein
MLQLVLLDATFGKLLHLDPEGKQVDEKLIEAVDLFQQMTFSLRQV